MRLLHPPGLCQRLRNPGRKMWELLKQFSVWEKRLENWLGKNMTANAFSLIWNWIVVDPYSDFRVSKNDNWEKFEGEVIRRNTAHIGQLKPLRSIRLRGELEEFESWGKTSTLVIFSILPVEPHIWRREGGGLLLWRWCWAKNRMKNHDRWKISSKQPITPGLWKLHPYNLN